MNFLNFLSSGFNILGFNLQNQDRTSSSFFRGSHSAPSGSELSSTLQTSVKSDTQKEKTFKTEPTIVIPNVQVGREEPADIGQLLSQQNQMLLERYLQLVTQLENKNVEQPQQVKTEETVHQIGRVHKKKIKKVTACDHSQREHYAKGFCKNCYLKYGRTKKPWLCSHQKLYAGGLCQNCYINKYNKEKRNREHEAEKSAMEQTQQPNSESSKQ